mmetsp:Transcript_20661/g.41616  ORF Transcript_20661/g.41616 Transcript_20661/m.41616 type:complete len:386 (-) Transcript_20661:230-1387(-)
MSVYWLIAAPAENGSKEETWKSLQRMTMEISTNHRMKIPDLRVGTLDALMMLSDELEKYDRYMEGVVHRLEKELREQAGGGAEPMIEGQPLEHFLSRLDTQLTSFEWDQARFPVKQALPELVMMMQDCVSAVDEKFKQKVMEYNTIKSNLNALERKGQGALNAKSLVEYVRKDHVIATEKLNTVFCAVPKFAVAEFKDKYEGWSAFTPGNTKFDRELNGVVPRSALKVTEDSEYELYRVVVFRACEDAFKVKAREARVTIRDFTFTEGQAAVDSEEMSKLKDQSRDAKTKLVRSTTINYKEASGAWLHLKAIRVFVESVLRYGLPPTFQAMLIKPGKNEDRVRKALAGLYGHLSAGYDKDGEDGPNAQKFYPYVDMEVKLFAEEA